MAKEKAAGLCFPWALEFAKQGDTIVHAQVHDLWDGHIFWHAWVERKGKVYDWQTIEMGLGKGKPISVQQFYKDYRPENVSRYTYEQALVACVRYGHAGPFNR